jgi:hypothetical protein
MHRHFISLRAWEGTTFRNGTVKAEESKGASGAKKKK